MIVKLEEEEFRSVKAKLSRNSILGIYNILISYEDENLEDIILSDRALKLLGDPSPLNIMEDILDEWINVIHGEDEFE